MSAARRASVRIAPLLVGLGTSNAALAEPTQAPQPQIRFDEHSEYQRVFVVDEGDRRVLRFGTVDGDDQSVISLSDPRAVPMDYIRLSLVAAVWPARLQRALVIGVGGGTFPRLLHRTFDDIHIDAVDIDPVVLTAATELFGLRADQRLRLHAEDGARWVKQEREPYDLIMLDAYGAEGIPEALATEQFFRDSVSQATATGVIVLNISLEAEQEATVLAHVRRAVPHVVCLRTIDNLNLVVFGSRSPLDLGSALVSRARTLSRRARPPFDLPALAERVTTQCKHSPELR